MVAKKNGQTQKKRKLKEIIFISLTAKRTKSLVTGCVCAQF